MALFQFRWLRNFVRRNTRPIKEPVAHTWKRRFSVAYALLAWNAFGFILYQIYNGKSDWAKAHGIKNEYDGLSPGIN